MFLENDDVSKITLIRLGLPAGMGRELEDLDSLDRTVGLEEGMERPRGIVPCHSAIVAQLGVDILIAAGPVPLIEELVKIDNSSDERQYVPRPIRKPFGFHISCSAEWRELNYCTFFGFRSALIQTVWHVGL
jgi:hypothetical protein